MPPLIPAPATDDFGRTPLHVQSARDVNAYAAGDEVEGVVVNDGEQPGLEMESALDFLSYMFQRTSCACPNMFTEDEDLSDAVQQLLSDLKRDGKSRTVAIQKLYRMSDRERMHNRIPIICTTKFNVISALVPCLAEDASPADRRRALLLIANLSIPVENKAVILLTETIDDLLPALARIVLKRLHESYLATACLFNLSFLDDAKVKLLSYVAVGVENEIPRSSYDFCLPTDSPFCVLRILESLVVEYTPFLASPLVSVQREAVRWTMATFRNLATAQENAFIIGTKTRIPSLALACLNLSDRDLSLWTKDSLEDACLMLLVYLAKDKETITALRGLDSEIRRALSKLDGQGGIHELRAKAIISHLDCQTIEP